MLSLSHSIHSAIILTLNSKFSFLEKTFGSTQASGKDFWIHSGAEWIQKSFPAAPEWIQKSFPERRTCYLALVYWWSCYLMAWVRTLYNCSMAQCKQGNRGSILYCCIGLVPGGAELVSSGLLWVGKWRLSPAGHFQQNLKSGTLTIAFHCCWTPSLATMPFWTCIQQHSHHGERSGSPRAWTSLF